MDPPGQVAQLDEGLLGLAVGVLDQPLGAGRVRVPLVAGPTEVHGQGHQSLLRAVVQVPLDALPLDLDRVDDARAAVGQRRDLLVELLGAARAQQQRGQAAVEQAHQRGSRTARAAAAAGPRTNAGPARAHPRSVTSGQM